MMNTNSPEDGLTGCQQNMRQKEMLEPPSKKQKIDILGSSIPDISSNKGKNLTDDNKKISHTKCVKSRQKSSATVLNKARNAERPISLSDNPIVFSCGPAVESPRDLPTKEAPAILSEANNTIGASKGGFPADKESIQAQKIHLKRLSQWELISSQLPVAQYGVTFRITNLEQVRDLFQAHKKFHDSLQQLFDDFTVKLHDGDLVQLCLDSDQLSTSFLIVRRHKEPVSAAEFLDNIADLSQSNTEIRLDGTLRLVVTVIKNSGGCGRRVLGSLLYSQVIRKKKRHLVDLNNRGNNLCFGGSLYAVMTPGKHTQAELMEKAKRLYEELGISEERKVMLSDVETFERHLKVNIRVVRNVNNNWETFVSGKDPQYQIYFLLLYDGHYYGILNIKGFFGMKNYCSTCGTPYSHSHQCKYLCLMCLKANCERESVEWCPKCNRLCKSRTCLERHRFLASQKKVNCLSRIMCETCNGYRPQKHKCKRCQQCQNPVGDINTHLCFMPPLKESKTSDKYIFYDIECLQEEGNHIPIYIFAMCFKKGETWEFKERTCVSEFVETFINPKYRGYTFIAHNAMRYDSYFIVRELLTEKQKINLIAQGSKLICVTVIKLGIKFLDSSNFLPMKLAELPQAMGFEESKGFFPHIFNTRKNSNYVGPMPRMEDYGIDNMMPLEKAKFLSWYSSNKNNTFDLEKELASYCQQDVKILRKACILYREEIMAMTVKEKAVNTDGDKQPRSGIDPFQLVTLAGVSMAMYKYMFLKPNTIALLPHDNYHRQTKRYSTPGIQWLLYLEHTEGIEIKHALKGGEVAVDHYFLDGYAKINGRPTAFEFNGCFFHGCPICYEPNARNPVTGTTYSELNDTMKRKHSYLSKKGYVVRNIWEHEWNMMIESDKDLREFFFKKKLPLPLQPRDAFFGGRTNAVSLYHKTKPDEEIHYYDFTSLYPFVNKTKEYPIGHPRIIYKDFGPLSEYFGLAKVKVLPPRGLFFPVLPIKMGGKLMFPLCRTCAETKQWEPCAHTDEERALEGTWTTVELLKAIEKSYKVMDIFEIWHFEEQSKDLFSGYVNKNLRQKQEASGYPSWCTDEEKKNAYINTFCEKEGVQLRPDQIVKNPAKRQISKLLLNSLWGKFGQRTNMPNTSIVGDPKDLLKYSLSMKYEVTSFDLVSDDAVIVSWKYGKDRYTRSGDTNALIACFTTAYARLELYNVLDRLQDRCLYYDTDSVIFVSRQGDWNPPLGDFLGDLTSELPTNTYITEFVSSGPKSYGYKLSDGQVCMKVKGITLNVSNSEKINFDTFKDLVLSYCMDKDQQNPRKISVRQNTIVSTKGKLLIQTRSLQKTLMVTYDKRALCKDFKSLPYGY